MATRTQNARITVTLSGVATTEELAEMENRIMSALSDAVGNMRTAVEAAVGRLGDPGELDAALAAERARYEALVSSEEVEDAAQDAELQAARSEVDRLVSEQTAAAGELVTLADQLNNVGTAVDEADDDIPIGDVEVPEVVVPDAPAPDAPVDEPVVGPPDAPAPDAPAPDAPAPDVDADVPPAPAPDAPAAPADGPVDADGNPVAAPTL